LGVGAGPDLVVVADRSRCEQIVVNLVQNAIKFTESGGSVCVTWDREGTEAVIRVEDTGIGISADDLPRIFEPFYKVDKARAHTARLLWDRVGVGHRETPGNRYEWSRVGRERAWDWISVFVQPAPERGGSCQTGGLSAGIVSENRGWQAQQPRLLEDRAGARD